jgi:uncharacterized protein with PIN domain
VNTVASRKVQFREVKDELPICPYCGRDLDEILYQKRDPVFGKDRFVFFCPHCRRVLQIAAQHDKI